ncbi:MAG: AMP-binding protein [Pyrinomonadaceae bacterium]|nr:AMP-binding protein [Pyrinomonadaceae bacterium]
MQDTHLLEDQPIAWTPTPDVIERAQLTRFMKQVGVSTWDELYEFSIRDVEKFTEEVLKFLDIRFGPPYEKLLDTSNGIEMPTWLAGAGLNITEMCLDRWVRIEREILPAYDRLGDEGKWEEAESLNSTIVEAVIWEDETGNEISVSYAQLARAVNKCATGLTAHGLKRGDAIGIHLPMAIETVVALVAIGRIGAIAVPVFSGYGVEAIASRMAAVNAKALFTCAPYTRRGKAVNAREVAMQAVNRVPSIEKVFVVSEFGEGFKPVELLECGTAMIADASERLEMFGAPDPLSKKVVGWFSLLYSGNFLLESDPEPTSAEDPLIILYTSGTTGKPKGIAHTHASFPIKAAQDMAFGTDVGRGTRICWYTDIGWMMGPWLIYGALINGATICIYDGAPDYPTPDRMWEFCAKHKVEVLGISPTLIRALSNSGDDLPKKHDLSSLRAFASTGEPWNPAPWWWLFEKVGNSKLPIINYSGGTEIAGGILMGNPLLPIKPCSFPAPCPGMDVDILDEEGKPVPDGTVGELVIKQPWIGMARGFWQEKERYLETYWRRFKNIWVHGDWAMRDKDGHWFILGRSDDTLKVAGKRVGPAEVESLLVAHPFVTEAAVIGVPDEVKGTAMVAFVVTNHEYRISNVEPGPSEHSKFDIRNSELESELRSLVAKDMGKPLAPSKIHFVSALPKTRNAKVMRRVIRSAYLGEDPGDLSALENPQAVKEIAAASEHKG